VSKIFLAALSLEEAVERAMAESVNLQKSAIDLGLAEYKADRLWAEIFPSFTLSGGLAVLPSTPLFTAPGFQYDKDKAGYSVSFGVSLGFNTGIPYSMKLIDLAYRRGLLDYENARRQLEIQVTKSFYNLLAARENISHLEESLELAEKQLEQNRVAKANGLISELTWHQSRLGAETARYNLSTTQGSYRTGLGEFLAGLGMEPDPETILEGAIEIAPFEADPEALILEYLPKRPDVVSQRQTIERLELSRKQSAGSSRVPSLDLSATWRGGPNPGFSGQFSDSLSGNLTLRIPIDPWIPGTRSNQTIRSAGAETEKARLDLKNTETAAKSQIRSLAEGLRNFWGSLEIARLRVEIALRTYELSEEGFRNGAVEFLSLENTRNDLADARQRLLQGELAYQNAVLDLAAALNVDWKTLTRSGE
jgi:outer membrane protein TolC